MYFEINKKKHVGLDIKPNQDERMRVPKDFYRFSIYGCLKKTGPSVCECEW